MGTPSRTREWLLAGRYPGVAMRARRFDTVGRWPLAGNNVPPEKERGGWSRWWMR